MPPRPAPWQTLHAEAGARGLNLRWAVPRARIDPRFADLPATGATPAALYPGYRAALVLGSAGSAFWRGFRAAHAPASGAASSRPADPVSDPVPDPTDDPLDRYTEGVVNALADLLRADDPHAVAVYPFRHARQVLGFTRLLGDEAPWLGSAPFGVIVHPRAGPWWALRGALLTGLEPAMLAPGVLEPALLEPAVLGVMAPQPPRTPIAAASPCAECPAPCVAACPVGAVAKAGFDWRACAGFRLGAPTCRETCLARNACPVAPELRYDAEAVAFHYRASLRELETLRVRDANDAGG